MFRLGLRTGCVDRVFLSGRFCFGYFMCYIVLFVVILWRVSLSYLFFRGEGDFFYVFQLISGRVRFCEVVLVLWFLLYGVIIFRYIAYCVQFERFLCYCLLILVSLGGFKFLVFDVLNVQFERFFEYSRWEGGRRLVVF